MKSAVALGPLAAAMMLALASCVYPPPPGAVYEPVPGPPAYVAPAPPYVAYARCAPGWHWVRGHRNRWGRWVRAHCARNW
jgi:hypothetical protein